MTDYLQECYVAGRTSMASRVPEHLAAISAVLAISGPSVRLIGWILVPEDETLFLLWRADDESSVRAIAREAGIGCDRITEVVAFTVADV